MSQNNDIYVMGPSAPSPPGKTPGKFNLLWFALMGAVALAVVLYFILTSLKSDPETTTKQDEKQSVSPITKNVEDKKNQGEKKEVIRANANAQSSDLTALKEKSTASPAKRVTTKDTGDFGRKSTKTPLPSLPARLQETLLFQFDSYMLQPSGMEKLETLYKKIKGRQGALIVEGHTCAIGSELYNQKLSKKRAEAAAGALKEWGLNPMLKIIIKSWGEKKPAAKNDSAEGRVRNRRVEILLKEK
jgi:outer membrane protein OmpA-like peptidoglycan-associated protein